MSKKKNQRTNPDITDKEIIMGKKGKKNVPAFSLFTLSFGSLDSRVIKRQILFLILVSLVTKFLILFATTSVFHSFIDFFDFQYYFEHALSVTNGKIPYVDFGFDYPPLAFIPIFLAFIPAYLLNNIFAFVYSFQILMVICDTIIIICIYLIGLKIYNEKLRSLPHFSMQRHFQSRISY